MCALESPSKFILSLKFKSYSCLEKVRHWWWSFFYPQLCRSHRNQKRVHRKTGSSELFCSRFSVWTLKEMRKLFPSYMAVDGTSWNQVSTTTEGNGPQELYYELLKIHEQSLLLSVGYHRTTSSRSVLNRVLATFWFDSGYKRRFHLDSRLDVSVQWRLAW